MKPNLPSIYKQLRNTTHYPFIIQFGQTQNIQSYPF